MKKRKTMKRLVFSALAVSVATSMAAAEYDFQADFTTEWGAYPYTSHLASDYANSGTAYDYSGNARFDQSVSKTVNGNEMTIVMNVSTSDGQSFQDSVNSWEQTQWNWDGTPFTVGGMVFHFGNFYNGQWGIGEQDGINIGSMWENDSETLITYHYADGASVTTTLATNEAQFQYGPDPTEMFVTYGVYFDGDYDTSDAYTHGTAIGYSLSETVTLVPAPGAIALFGLGLGGLARRRRRG